MLITSPCVVSLTWQIADTQGQTIDELTSPVEFYLGGDDLLQKVEEILVGQTIGFETALHLEPEHAFGDYQAELVFFEKRSLFSRQIEPGMQFEGPPPGATTPDLPADVIYTVTEVYPSHVVLDGNHPLAGIALRLSLKVHGVRVATAAELESQTIDEPSFSVVSTASTNSRLH